MNSIGRPNLQSLEILSDSTEQMDFLTAMLPGFVNLRRVVLHNSTPESSKQPQKPNLALLYCLMACTSVEHIVMKGFEFRCDREQPLQLALVSPSVRVLDLDFGKWYKSFCSIVSLDMPRLERLSFAGTNSSCLDHLMQGKLKVKLAKGAPALRYFNNVGKFALKKKVGCMLWLWWKCVTIKLILNVVQCLEIDYCWRMTDVCLLFYIYVYVYWSRLHISRPQSMLLTFQFCPV